jgi:hypothetical protein
MKKIKYYRKNIYGKDLMYLAEGAIKTCIKTLTKKETLNIEEMGALIILGHEFEEILAPK